MSEAIDTLVAAVRAWAHNPTTGKSDEQWHGEQSALEDRMIDALAAYDRADERERVARSGYQPSPRPIAPAGARRPAGTAVAPPSCPECARLRAALIEARAMAIGLYDGIDGHHTRVWANVAGDPWAAALREQARAELAAEGVLTEETA